VDYLQGLVADAVSKGATVINQREGGGEAHGNLMRPAVVYPVDKSMRSGMLTTTTTTRKFSFALLYLSPPL